MSVAGGSPTEAQLPAESAGALWPLMLPTSQHGLDTLCSVSARGVRVRFADGRERLCGTSGLWNANLGYGNPTIARAAADALLNASYLSVWSYENIYAREAAAALIEVAGTGNYARVLFSTSGGAANDMAMKLVRHYHALRGGQDRKGVIAMHNGYHGLTYGAFALTSAQLGKRMYGVDRRLVGHVHPNDPGQLDALLKRLRGKIAAVVVEPVLGSGAISLTDEYIEALLELRREHGFLLVADEVSTGFGRLGGTVFATERWPESPDVLITSKGLTNGTLAAAAVIVSGAVAGEFMAAGAILGHAETQAGTPVVCAAILATIGEMRRLDAPTRASELSERLDVELQRMVSDSPLISGTSGRGCLRSLQLTDVGGRSLDQSEVSSVVGAIRDAGALVAAGPGCIQLEPALVYSDDDLEELLACVTSGVTAYARGTLRAQADSQPLSVPDMSAPF